MFRKGSTETSDSLVNDAPAGSNILDIEVPLIAAVNGPVRLHSEYILLADIVLATPATVFQAHCTILTR
jgi:enoyl-CoA hydratase/carnithine racemase